MTESELPLPQISVVIPTYQRAALLERSLESLTRQTLEASQFEVVVVDDGSSDWTASVCDRLAQELSLRRLRIVNSGISAAKNLGLFASRAPLVLFFDDDDIADPGLLDAHLEAHRAHPEEHVAVLGYTTWAPELEITPLMEYVTEIGHLLFAYQAMDDGERLDHTYFWGGRTSCKRAFLAQHGVFDQDFPAIIEDIELGFRLARRGLEVVHARGARSYMLRAVTFDDFARRCVKRGRGLWLLNSRHDDPAVERYCQVEEALDRWPTEAPELDAKMARVRDLEARYARDNWLDEGTLEELRELYRWTFAALQDRGIAEAAADAGAPGPAERAIVAGTAWTPAIAPNPVFIIGSPRSGTSALGWALAEHSELWTDQETDIFFYLLEYPHVERAFEVATQRLDGNWLGNHGVTVDQFLEYLGVGLNALLTSTTGGRTWVDQTPANTYVVERLGRMFPQARFIHLLRDGRRVVHSMMNFHRVLGGDGDLEGWRRSGRLPSWAADFREACTTWARLTRLALDFCAEHPERTLTITNEQMIADPEGVMRETLTFLGLHHEEAPARFLRTQRINSSFAASGASSQAPLSAGEPWMDWTQEQRIVFQAEAGQVMVECGMATEDELAAWVQAPDGGSKTPA
jgi:glycosyltransferase involved in cell wall biosynthesis